MSQFTPNTERYPPLVGIIKLQGGTVLQGDKLIKQDLWFDSGLKGTREGCPDEGLLFHQDGNAQIIDAQARFWDAANAKDFSAHLIFDITGLLAVPGYIDIQTNGSFGLDYTSPPVFDDNGEIISTVVIPDYDSTSPNLTTTATLPTVNKIRSKVALDLANKKEIEMKNTEKWHIKSTKPIHVSTPQMSRSFSSRVNTPSMNASTGLNHSQHFFQPTPQQSTHLQPSSVPTTPISHNNSTTPTFQTPPPNYQFQTPPQSHDHHPTTFTLPTPPLIESANGSSSNIQPGGECGLDSSPPPSLNSNVLDLYAIPHMPSLPPNISSKLSHNTDKPLVPVQTNHLHPTKARTFLNAIADYIVTNSDSFQHEQPSLYDDDDEPIIPTLTTTTNQIQNDEKNTQRDQIASIPINPTNNTNTQYTIPEDQEIRLESPLTPEQLKTPKKSSLQPFPLNPSRSLTRHASNPNIIELSFPFNFTPFKHLLVPSIQPNLSVLRQFLYKRDRDMLYVNERLPQFGVTSFCPTIISSDEPTFGITGKRVIDYMLCVELARKKGLILRQSNMLGLHLEGPFLSVPGAHNRDVLGPPKDIEHTTKIYNGDSLFPFTSIVTLAPELDGALDVIESLTRLGIVVSMGHSNATIEQAKNGINSGAGLITHMFNAMRAFHHRDPGLIGILGATEPYNIHFSVISDGYHAHPFSLNIAYSSSPDKLILVTDSMAAMGLPDGEYKLGTQNVTMNNLKAVLTQSPSNLAGAVVPLDQCVRNFVSFTHCPIEHAILAATKAPAELLGIYPRKGSLIPGADADIVLLDPNTLEVMATIINGQLCYVHGDIFPMRIKYGQ